MNASSIVEKKEVSRLVLKFDEQLRMHRASELAACNRLLEAAALLCPAGRGASSAAELDMLARINVKQRRFAEAKKCWEQAITRDNDKKEDCEQCLQVLEVYSAQCYKRKVIDWWIALSLLALSLVISIWTLIIQAAN
jgi:tetratricopeptide (TPR) repeat protein